MTSLSYPTEVRAETRSIAVPLTSRQPLIERRFFGIVAPLTVAAALLGLWELTGLFVNRTLISSPQQVAVDFVTQFISGPAKPALLLTLRELYIGTSIGLTVGVLFGMVIGRYRLLHAVSSPFINTANATPLNILISLFVLWVGVSTEARLLFIVLITFFPVVLNVTNGIRNVNKGYVEVGRMVGMSERQLMWTVMLPGAMPYVFAGIRLGVGLGVVGVVVAEMEVALAGMGYYIDFYGSGFQTGKMLALVILLTLIGLFNVLVVRAIQRRWFRWINAAY